MGRGGGGAGQLVPTASSGVWEWVVRHLSRGQEEQGEVSAAGPGMFWLYYAVACGYLLTEVLWWQEEKAHEAEDVLGLALSHQFAVWNWHSSVLRGYY